MSHLSGQSRFHGKSCVNDSCGALSVALLPLALSDDVDGKLHVLFDGADDGLDVVLRRGTHDQAHLVQDGGQELVSVLKAAQADTVPPPAWEDRNQPRRPDSRAGGFP